MKNIIVREYLESLTESEELDYIFPILLEVMDFKIITTPKITKGLAQYGKDIIAIGKDTDGHKKRFYFEVKGGADRDVTTHTFHKADGIVESIREAKLRPFQDFSNPDFNLLPIKIILVHNGIMKANVKETFDGFIQQEFPNKKIAGTPMFFNRIFKSKSVQLSIEFARWDIYDLTELFTKYLFNEYLLTDEDSIKLFKRVLVLITTPKNNFSDFLKLIDFVFERAGNHESMGERKKLLFFETIKMISFIVYHYSKEANNLEVAKKCLPYSILKLWTWILENQQENNKK